MNNRPIKSTVLAALAAAAVLSPSAAILTAHGPMQEWYFGESINMPPGSKYTEAVSGCEGPTQEWLCLFNVSSHPAKAEVTLFFEDAPPKTLHYDLPPAATKVLKWHDKALENDVPKRKLFSTRVRANQPLIAQSCRSENPGGATDKGNSTTSRFGHAGPLGKKETKWALADSLVSTNLTGWQDLEFLTILNPNPGQSAKVSITWFGRDGRTTHKVTIAPERVVNIDLAKLPESSRSRTVATAGVIVESNIPIIPESVRRVVISENRSPRGMWSLPLYPVGDQKLDLH
jgi:hypothetical protein